MATLNIYLLGSPRIDLNGEAVTLERNKALALLAYLAMEDGSQARETLSTLLWPEYDHERAYAYLRRTLWEINEKLGDGWLDAGREQVALTRTPGLRLDVGYFREALEECAGHGHRVDQVCERCVQPLEQAVTFYRGDFMAGFSLRDSAAFDEWQFFQSEKLKNELAGALRRLALAYNSQPDASRAIQAARRWLALDLLNEEAHRLLMQIYVAAGRRNAALRQYQECQRILKGELGVEPQPETTRLYESIKAGETSKITDSKLNLQSSTFNLQPTRLPNPATPFVGRVEELTEVTALLQNPDCRMLTLVGPGGIGKTRLSIQTAVRLVDLQKSNFSDGVVFVPLAPVNSPEWLVSAIASSLNLQFRNEQMLNDVPESQKVQLIEYLRDRQILLVLDNFEHLIAGADLLAEILASGPGLKMLLTSRERLRLAQEWVFEVGGMSFPQDGSLEQLEAYSAVQLFLQNARRVRADFEITEADKAGITRICRMVEGVPLAIELAAAWVKLLSCDEIAGEIERNLDFLTTNLRGLPERHQSLRAVFEHSWSLLSPQEQDTLMRLSVLRSPFRRETGESVVTESPSDVGSQPRASTGISTTGRGNRSFLLLLSALVDKSLLRRVGNDGREIRFGMHDLIRQYAAEKLDRIPGAAEQTRSRHSTYYAAWLAKMQTEMHSSRQIQALGQIEQEIEDVRAAWRWMIESGEMMGLSQSMGGLYHFYNIRNRQQEAEEDFRLGVESLSGRLASSEAKTPVEQAKTVNAYLLAYYSSVLFNTENFPLADQVYGQALKLADQLSEPDQALIYTLLSYGTNRLAAEQVEVLYRRSQEYFSRVGDNWSKAMSMLVYVFYAQYTLLDMELARKLCQESQSLFEGIGDRVGMVFSLINQSALCYALGEYETVKRLSREGIDLCRALGDRWRTATALLYLGQACVALGEYAEAKEVYRESLDLVRELGNRRVMARYLSCLGYVHYLEAEYELANDLFGEALEYSRQIGDQREMGMSNMNLGNIALAGGDIVEARKRYQAAIDLLEELTYARWELSICVKRMGSLCYRLGETSLAWKYIRRALEISVYLKRTPEILENLVGIAELMGNAGQAVEAVQVLAFALEGQEMAQDVRERAQGLLSAHQAQLSPEDFSSALLAGQAATVVEILQRCLSD